MQSPLAFHYFPTQHCLIFKFQNYSIKLDIYAIEIRKGIFYSADGFWEKCGGKNVSYSRYNSEGFGIQAFSI